MGSQMALRDSAQSPKPNGSQMLNPNAAANGRPTSRGGTGDRSVSPGGMSNGTMGNGMKSNSKVGPMVPMEVSS